ncbi:MAG: hypothetical protein KDC87_05115 [Planctomycetes bacterium]|nr:hypothetical protein [Planctomycetota bacterium]
MPALVLASIAIPGQEATRAARSELTVCLVADPEEPRGEAFAEFLRPRFKSLQVVDPRACDPSRIRADVVLLDWGDGGQVGAKVPLGARASWKTPTVLLGRTGVYVAVPWRLDGWFG